MKVHWIKHTLSPEPNAGYNPAYVMGQVGQKMTIAFDGESFTIRQSDADWRRGRVEIRIGPQCKLFLPRANVPGWAIRRLRQNAAMARADRAHLRRMMRKQAWKATHNTVRKNDTPGPPSRLRFDAPGHSVRPGEGGRDRARCHCRDGSGQDYARRASTAGAVPHVAPRRYSSRR